jgi:hypothetical protein
MVNRLPRQHERGKPGALNGVSSKLLGPLQVSSVNHQHHYHHHHHYHHYATTNMYHASSSSISSSSYSSRRLQYYYDDYHHYIIIISSSLTSVPLRISRDDWKCTKCTLVNTGGNVVCICGNWEGSDCVIPYQSTQ